MGKNRKAAKNFTNRLGGQVGDDAEASPTMEFDDTVDVVDSGASNTYPVQASSLRKNGHAIIKGNPCKIVDIATSKPGKHGHAKMVITGLDLFTGKKYEELTPSSHTMEVPIVTKKEYILVDMGQEGYLSLLKDDGHMKQGIRVTEEEMVKSVREKLDKRDDSDIMVTILGAMDKEMVMTIKVTK